MVLFPTPYIASAAAAGVPLTYPRILYANWARGLSAGLITASSSAADSPPDSVSRPDSVSFWSPTSLPATLTIDLGQSRTFNSVGLGAHTLASSGVTVKVESTPSLTESYTQFSVDFAAGDDGASLLLDTDRTHRYVKFTFTGTSVMPKIGSIYIQSSLVMQRRVSPPYKPIKLARNTVLRGKVTMGGQFLSQTIQRQGVMGTAPFKYLTAAWIRNYFDPFSLSARRYPYFFAWNPLEFPDEVGYCISSKDILPEYMGVVDNMQVTIEMAGLGYNQ